jgi:hypothetical protein
MAISCEEARRLMLRDDGVPSPDGTPTELFLHVRACDGCRAQLEEQLTVRGLLADLVEEPVPPGFAARVCARVEIGASPVERVNWKSWTLRLTPVAAGLLLAGALMVIRASRASVSLDTVLDQWTTGDTSSSAATLLLDGAPANRLLQELLVGGSGVSAPDGGQGPRQ